MVVKFIMGHQEGSIAKVKYGGVVDNAPSAKFTSFHGVQTSFFRRSLFMGLDTKRID